MRDTVSRNGMRTAQPRRTTLYPRACRRAACAAAGEDQDLVGPADVEEPLDDQDEERQREDRPHGRSQEEDGGGEVDPAELWPVHDRPLRRVLPRARDARHVVADVDHDHLRPFGQRPLLRSGPEVHRLAPQLQADLPRAVGSAGQKHPRAQAARFVEGGRTRRLGVPDPREHVPYAQAGGHAGDDGHHPRHAGRGQPDDVERAPHEAEREERVHDRARGDDPGLGAVVAEVVVDVPVHPVVEIPLRGRR